MMVGVAVPRPVGMAVFMFVKHDLELPAEHICDAAQSFKARHMGAAFKPRDHGLGHAQTSRKLRLGFSSIAAHL